MSGSPTVLMGNITQDPDLKILQSGSGKLTFSIAVNHYWTDQSGEKQEKTSFFNVVAWRNLAEDAARVLEKGMRVVVAGRLEQRSWENDEGEKRSVVELVADDIAASVRGIDSVTRAKRSDGDKRSGGKPPAKQARKKQPSLEDEEPF